MLPFIVQVLLFLYLFIYYIYYTMLCDIFSNYYDFFYVIVTKFKSDAQFFDWNHDF